MGPSLDLRLIQSRWGSDELRREALKVPKELKPTKKKNVTTNLMKEKIGRVFVPTQDLSQLAPATIKGLQRKRKRQNTKEEEEEEEEEEGRKQLNNNVGDAQQQQQQQVSEGGGGGTTTISPPSSKRSKTTKHS
jgi:hypothetical protein